MRKLLLGASLLGFLSLIPVAQAGEIVCVNGDELIKESQFAQKLKSEIEAKKREFIEKYQKRAQELIQKLQKLQQELSSGLLSEEAKKKKEEEFVKLQQELQTLQIEAQQEAQKYITEQLQKLDRLTKAALKALAKVKGFEAALDCNTLLYYSSDVDITKDVAKVVDQLAEQGEQSNPKGGH